MWLGKLIPSLICVFGFYGYRLVLFDVCQSTNLSPAALRPPPDRADAWSMLDDQTRGSSRRDRFSRASTSHT